MVISRRGLLLSSGAAALAAPAVPARAQERIELTIGSSFPTAVAWVQPGQSYFMPEVNRRLSAAGGRFAITWKEAWGGTLFRTNASVQAVGDGVVDIGYVWSMLEASKLPLSQVSLNTPFATSDCAIVGASIHDTIDKVGALRLEWERNGLKFLGASTSDTFHIFTKTPIRAFEDLKGRRLSAAGSAGLWIRDSGAVAVASSVASFYTDVQTGVSDGTFTNVSAMASSKTWEVAPHVTLADFGSLQNGGLAMNKTRFDRLPEPVREVLVAVGRDFSVECGKNVLRRAASDLDTIKTAAVAQGITLTVNDMTGAPRQRYADAMSNLAKEWAATVAGRGLPAGDVLSAYLSAIRSRGATPARDWAI
jgi:TRAP-type transport system periplasmic protein